MDLISVITPTHNNSGFIEETIKSVLSQSYSNLELIIVDDCSNDDTIKKIESINDPRIKLIKNDSNRGAAYSRNVGLRNATGDYISFLDGDDIWDKTKLEKQHRFMVDNDYLFTFTNYGKIDQEGHISNKYITGPKKVTHRMLLRSNYIGCLTVMFKKELYPDLQIPDDILKRNDYALWLKLSKKADCYLLNECLSFYRFSPNGISKGSKIKLFKHHVILFKKVMNYGAFRAIICALINTIFLFIRKILYIRKFK